MAHVQRNPQQIVGKENFNDANDLEIRIRDYGTTEC